MKKRFIEYDLSLADISEASAREKSIHHSHPSTLHIWWARRPLASSRATAFAARVQSASRLLPGTTRLRGVGDEGCSGRTRILSASNSASAPVFFPVRSRFIAERWLQAAG